MKRSHLFLGISGALALLVAGSLALNGCTAQTEPYNVQQFATLRIMNFAPSDANCNPTAPMDIYWDTKTPVSVSGNNAKIYNLKYGDAAVYTTSLSAASNGTTYHIVATPTRIPGKAWITDDVTLSPSSASSTGKYTYLITLNPSTPGSFLRTLVQDGQPNAAQNMTYVRFINMQANAGPLTVRVNDPVTGQAINSTPLDFNQIGTYTALHYVQDTSFAFFVVNSSNQVLARLSYQTFIGGSSYTLVYAGDPCQTVLNNPADTTTSALDTLRLRAFDDNTTGNDQTNPILYSYRYNIVNDIYPVGPGYSTLGFLNGQAFSAHYGFSVNPVLALEPGGAYTDSGNGAYNVYYQSTALTDPLDVKVFSTTPAGGSSTLVYDYNLPGPQASVPMDKPITFLFTGPDTALKNGTFWNDQGRILQVPDVSNPNTITLAFYNATNTSYKVAGTALFASYYVKGGYDTTLTNIASNNRSTMTVIQLPVSSSGSFTISDSIGSGTNKVLGDSKTFTADPGGIYEVFSTGIKSDPHLLIMRVNGNQ